MSDLSDVVAIGGHDHGRLLGDIARAVIEAAPCPARRARGARYRRREAMTQLQAQQRPVEKPARTGRVDAPHARVAFREDVTLLLDLSAVPV